VLGGFIPESAKFLTLRGRIGEAQATLRRFGSQVVAVPPQAWSELMVPGAALPPIVRGRFGATAALTITGVAWGLINFGLLLWLPTEMVAKGYSMALASKLLAASALIALPTVFIATLLYSRWSTKWSLAAAIAVTALGLIGVLQLETAAGVLASPVLAVALLIIGSNAIIAVLLPYAAETYPLRVRGRATGWVAGCTKMGGLIAQGLSIAALVPPLTVAAGAILAPVGLSLVMTAAFGAETRDRDLRELEPSDLRSGAAKQSPAPRRSGGA
jgi:putative MFS transporter